MLMSQSDMLLQLGRGYNSLFEAQGIHHSHECSAMLFYVSIGHVYQYCPP